MLLYPERPSGRVYWAAGSVHVMIAFLTGRQSLCATRHPEERLIHERFGTQIGQWNQRLPDCCSRR